MTKFFEAPDGRRLAYQDTGGADPVVLCLAGLTRNARDFAGLAAHLAPHYRVLRLDARGRGLSEWADAPIAEYTVLVEAWDALALLDHLEIPRAAIIGTSRGGILGMGIGAMLSGALFAEIVFSRPGIGKLLHEAVVTRNYPVVMGSVLVTTVFFVLSTLVSDIINATLDPRLRESGRSS